MECIRCNEEFIPCVTDKDNRCAICMALDGDVAIAGEDNLHIIQAIGILNQKIKRLEETKNETRK